MEINRQYTKLVKPRKDFSGKKFGYWTTIEVSGVKRYENKTGKNKGKLTVVWYYLCECVCGNKSDVGLPDLKQKKSTKCEECNIRHVLLDSQKGIKNFGQNNPNYRGEEHVPYRMFTRIKNGAKIRNNMPFKITLKDMEEQWIKQSGRCFYTGISLTFAPSETPDYNDHLSPIASLDRVNSSIGYFCDNVVWTSKTINLMKQSLSNTVFIDICGIVNDFNRKKDGLHG